MSEEKGRVFVLREYIGNPSWQTRLVAIARSDGSVIVERQELKAGHWETDRDSEYFNLESDEAIKLYQTLGEIFEPVTPVSLTKDLPPWVATLCAECGREPSVRIIPLSGTDPWRVACHWIDCDFDVIADGKTQVEAVQAWNIRNHSSPRENPPADSPHGKGAEDRDLSNSKECNCCFCAAGRRMTGNDLMTYYGRLEGRVNELEKRTK